MGLLLSMVVYVFAIFCVSFIGKSPALLEYPGYTEGIDEMRQTDIMGEANPFLSSNSMPKAMPTSFIIAILAEWPDIIRPVYLVQPSLVAVFFATSLGTSPT